MQILCTETSYLCIVIQRNRGMVPRCWLTILKLCEVFFLFMFFAWLLKGFGKAITHTDKEKPRTSWDRLSYEQKAWIHDHDNGR